uniref:Rotatin n=1 Tax=Pan troglodytes TaxID=9598 RepID=G2HJN0_PANTR|nr:rotatin [Pan troglodytes]
MKQEVLIIPRILPQEAAALGLLWLGAQASDPEEMARTGMQRPLVEVVVMLM